MKIRQKINLYFSTVTITMTGMFFLFIYTLVQEYRKQEFQERLKEQTVTTLGFLAEVREIDRDVIQTLNRFRIYELFQEKILLFDENKNLIYSSIDDTKILYSNDILKKLSKKVTRVEATEDDFDVVGLYLTFENKDYYGITKAYDTFGFAKVAYLKNVLIGTFIVLSIVIILISFYISRQIATPLDRMALEMNAIKDDTNAVITVPRTRDEINVLATQFNDLMKRLNSAFAFQKHAIHHISHELKTPIAVLVSNFERIEKEQDHDKLLVMIRAQKEGTKNLSDIINALLEISKTELGSASSFQPFRVDDLIYDLIEELKIIYPQHSFEVNIVDAIDSESSLKPHGNQRLMRSAFQNLMVNCIRFGSTQQATINISTSLKFIKIEFINRGKTLQEHEKAFLFQHFFRGENSKGSAGFGLGLVFVNKIMQLHHGEITYRSEGDDLNIMTIKLPLKHDFSLS